MRKAGLRRQPTAARPPKTVLTMKRPGNADASGWPAQSVAWLSVASGCRFAKTPPFQMPHDRVVSCFDQRVQLLVVHVKFRGTDALHGEAADLRGSFADLVVVGRTHHGIDQTGNPAYNTEWLTGQGRMRRI